VRASIDDGKTTPGARCPHPGRCPRHPSAARAHEGAIASVCADGLQDEDRCAPDLKWCGRRRPCLSRASPRRKTRRAITKSAARRSQNSSSKNLIKNAGAGSARSTVCGARSMALSASLTSCTASRGNRHDRAQLLGFGGKAENVCSLRALQVLTLGRLHLGTVNTCAWAGLERSDAARPYFLFTGRVASTRRRHGCSSRRLPASLRAVTLTSPSICPLCHCARCSLTRTVYSSSSLPGGQRMLVSKSGHFFRA
jgi:hypothetical protein